MEDIIAKLIEWIDKNNLPFRNGKVPALAKSLLAVIGVATAIATLISGSIWLKFIFFILLFAITTFLIIKERKRIEMLYLTKIRYNSRVNDNLYVVGIVFFLILLQILGQTGVFQYIGQLWKLIHSSFIDVINVSQGLEASANYYRSISILLLLSFSIFALQLAGYISPKKVDRKEILFDLYINTSHKYQWSYFLTWLTDKDWDRLCGNSVRVVGSNHTIYSNPPHSDDLLVRNYVQKQGREQFPEFKNELILNTKECQFGSFQKGILRLEVYPAELIKTFLKNRKMLESVLNHFICEEILGIESLQLRSDNDYIFFEYCDFEFLSRIDFYIAKFHIKPPLQGNFPQENSDA